MKKIFALVAVKTSTVNIYLESASIENVEAIKCLYESNEWINDLLVVLENK